MIFEIFKMAFESLLAKKTRSFLSMLGIIIGVSTVIAVFAIGQGARNAVDEQFAGLSAKSIMIMGNMGRPGSTASSKLSIDDVKVIRDNAEHIALATGIIQGNATVSYESSEASYSVVGTDLDFFQIANQKIVQGRMFSEEEINSKDRLVILGSDVVENLYTDKNQVIGSTITVGGKKLEVIGYFEETGGTLGRTSKDEAVYVPYQTAQSSILGSQGGNLMVTMEADDVNNISIATEEVTKILRTEHKLKDGQEDDFRVMDAGSMVGAAQDSASLMSTVLTLVAAITLLVSGIGIMNVMFVTVAERTKEIGIAKAIGGKQGNILTQFLLESVILSTVGGLIGVIIGQSAIPIISYFNLMTMSSSLSGPLLGFTFSAIVGVFFGFYPALKASKLDPVDALRSE
ncbi:TPA: macrolide ABC transporter permease [Candidatus Falkowbacteria bacterium]|nr:macrolide ABC transporter permease [Candidatus Falkowbacteria bacterium]HAY12547.1 macrolide ABC transporter permease [Candidatus Falkowbacteria bacterium]HBI96753.1 macrolide ABC transporter permease [Candidatus Falkowbacteria bacterium]HBT27912.1 macrolide ABC transporter permease [Candidatus Falkowbacteria bacterium]HBY14707.1 macrolide ABC transporter permease [Candidatus Falkowbacteria bacterium]